MKIIIEPHTLERAAERGATEIEITHVLENGILIAAKKDRLGKFLVFPYQGERNGKFYEEKKIEVYYIIENNQIKTITVYVFYGKWEE